MNNTFLFLMVISFTTISLTYARAESGINAAVWLGQTMLYFAAVIALFLPEPSDWPIILIAISAAIGLIMTSFQCRQVLGRWLIRKRWENEGGW